MAIRTRMGVASMLIAAIAVLAPGADAQAPGIKRTLMQRADLDDRREVIMGLAEIASGGATGRHTHFGTEVGYVLEGTSILEIDGEPARRLGAGDSYVIPAGKVHDARATGSSPAKVLATYVVDKGKPLATPAP